MRRPDQSLPPRRGSVLVIVMVTLLFAALALVAFMERAGVDLIVDQRDVLARRLRQEAYSALEVTLAVLSEFREAGQGLRSPAEGWGDPLAFAGYVPGEGREVQVAFEDESGKISLPRADATVLTQLFRSWEMPEPDAKALTDALLGWTRKNHTYLTTVIEDYEQMAIPYESPGRSLRSFQELAAVVKFRELFYDKEGRPNELWQRFAGAVSLFDFQRPNINGARPDTLAAVGLFDPNQRRSIEEYLRGTGRFQTQGPGFFQDAAEAQRIALGTGGATGGFGASIAALRIRITVLDGKTSYRLTAVVAPPGGATAVTTTATSQKVRSRGPAGRQPGGPPASVPAASASSQSRASTGQGQAPAARDLRYPFTLLEIRENDVTSPVAESAPVDRSF